MVSAKHKKYVWIFCRIWRLNSAISKIVLRDLDMLLEGQQFTMLISLKQWELAQICTDRLL